MKLWDVARSLAVLISQRWMNFSVRASGVLIRSMIHIIDLKIAILYSIIDVLLWVVVRVRRLDHPYAVLAQNLHIDRGCA